MCHRYLVVLLAFLTASSGCRCGLPSRKHVNTMHVADLLPGGVEAVRAGCESLFPKSTSDAERCTRTFVNAHVIEQLCGRARLDAGTEACVSMLSIAGEAIVLETSSEIFLVVDGADALD